MDQWTGVGAVVKVLQDILASPELALSHQLQARQNHDAGAPVLPRNVPTFQTPSIDQPLVSLQLPQTQTSTSSKDALRGHSLTDLASHLTTKILPYLSNSSLSPNYYGFVIGGVTPAALLGDFLASIFDQNVHVHLPRETLATTLEVAALNMLVQLFRLPENDWSIGKAESSGGGTLTTGATASNVLGLAMGREYVIQKAVARRRQELQSPKDSWSTWSCGEHGIAELMIQAGAKKIQILSTLPHSSIGKAAGIVGIGRANVVSIALATDGLQIDIDHLRREAAKSDVLNILAISAGEVNTGHFATNSSEQWTLIRKICNDHGIWIHVDGAFGLFARLFPDNDLEHKCIVEGVRNLEFADSITGDCHKLLNVPYECGVFFTRHKALLEDVFRNGNAAYLTSGAAANADFDDGFGAIQSALNIGIENSRRFRALPAYATLMAYGRDGYLDMLRRQIGLARRVTRWLLRDDRFEVLPSYKEHAGKDKEAEILAKTFIIILFRVRNDGEMKTFVKRVNETGKMYMSGTVWDGRPAARIAVSNWRADVERDGALIESVLDEVVRQDSESEQRKV